ncbi:hypothetical protein P691DRAFT_791597 [Macrolepiota fuliginosa MF-IS2]|uniref:Uncharacterized protein n=1 Tax=Macrolepiota fuliginosa MF-IS2 TaxID=1400762 RepID=A0A9P5XQ21_9AGAR|nr:hypothetical protein P691DRAFT_791597 [Macrolepiota fuliginosa MF-IS2]
MPPTSYHIDPPMPVYCLTGAQRYDPLRSVPRNAPRPPLPPSPPSSFPLEVLPAAHNAPNDHANINAPSQTADIFTAIAIKADDESSASEVKLDVLDLGSVPAFVPSLSLASQDEENANLRQYVSAKKVLKLLGIIPVPNLLVFFLSLRSFEDSIQELLYTLGGRATILPGYLMECGRQPKMGLGVYLHALWKLTMSNGVEYREHVEEQGWKYHIALQIGGWP